MELRVDIVVAEEWSDLPKEKKTAPYAFISYIRYPLIWICFKLTYFTSMISFHIKIAAMNLIYINVLL